MGEFGWAYIKGGALSEVLGPTGSVLLKTDTLEVSGSRKLTFKDTHNLELSGNIYVSGALTASSVYLPNLTSQTAITSKYLALDASNKLVLTSSIADTSLTAGGPEGSIQFHNSGGGISGSSAISYSNSVLYLSGSGSTYGEALSISGAIVPSVTNTYDLGSPDRQWKSLYVSSSTIYFGGEPLSVRDGGLDFGSGSATKKFRVGHLKLMNEGIHMNPNRVFNLNAFQMRFNGGVAYKRRVISWDYQALKTDFLIGVQSDTLTASVTITLPEASILENGQSFIIKDEGGDAQTYTIQIAATSPDTIDGETSILLESPYAAVNLYTNGSSKFFVY